MCVLLVFASSASVVSAREPNRPIKGGEPSRAMSSKDPGWRAGLKRRDARAARLAGASEKRRRRASKTSFEDASASEALALAKREFTDVFMAPLFDGADPEPGMKVIDQRGDGAALVQDVKTGKRTLVESNLPLQADDRGTMAPVDLSLETAGGDLRSDNALVPLSIERKGSADVTFTEAGFSAEVAGGAKDRTVQRAGDRSFFAELRTDTDAVVVPTAKGAELGVILRSGEASERQVLDLDLPAGATVRRARSKDPIPRDAPQSLEIRQGKRVLGYIHAPNAFDADGKDVRSRMSVKGDDVIIEVDHRGRDIRYPVFVDPEVNAYGDYNQGWPGWEWGQALREPRNSSVPEGYGAARNDCAYYCGLYQSHPTNTYNANGSYAHWYYRAPQNTFIYRALFGGITHDGYDIYGRNHTDSFQGVINSAYTQYEGMQYINQSGGVGPNPFGPAEQDYWGITHDYCVSPRTCSQPTSLSEGNYALFGIHTSNKFGGTGLGPAPQKGSTTMAHALVFLGDRRPPNLTGGLPGDQAWRNDAGDVTNAAPSARDNGLGLYSFNLTGVATGSGTQRVRATNDPNNDCSGSPHFLPCPANDRDGTTTFGYRLNEGANRLALTAQDAVGNNSGTHSWLERVDRSAPAVDVSGPLWDLRTSTAAGGDTSGNDQYALRVLAQDGDPSGPASAQRAGVRDIAVFVDDEEMHRAASDVSCTQSCSVDAREFVLNVDYLSEGEHRVRVVATDRLGHQSPPVEWTIAVPRDTAYAAQLAAWRSDTERKVDEQLPIVALSGPMPAPPGNWRDEAGCVADEEALRGCFDTITTWQRDVEQWLDRNLPTGGARQLPLPPTFEYSPGADDLSRDLTRRIRDAFAVARRTSGDATGAVNVAIGFHRPVGAAELLAVLPAGSVVAPTALLGYFDAGGAQIGGKVEASEPATLAQSVDLFYREQAAMTADHIAELENEQPADADESAAQQEGLTDQRRYKAHLDAGSAFITGAAVRVNTALVRVLLNEPAVKSIKLLPEELATLASSGADALSNVQTDETSLRHAKERRVGNSAYQQAEADSNEEATSNDERDKGADPRYETCYDRRYAFLPPRGGMRARRGKFPLSVLYPNLNFWAPPEHRADTVLGKPDGGHRLKQHRLRWRWPTLEQATWMCSAGAGDRNVELEVRPFPRREPRWSDNWEDNDARDLTRWNIPGNIHQDDLADGQRPLDGQPGVYPYDKNQYPDFSIIAQSSDLYQARREYFVDFTTNEGDTDVGSPVIFSAQSTSRAVNDPGVADENAYCNTRANDYKSCMFGRTNTCYAHRAIADPRVRSRVRWATGTAPDHFTAARSGSANIFDPTARNEVVQQCDPKPPGADDSNDDRAVRTEP